MTLFLFLPTSPSSVIQVEPRHIALRKLSFFTKLIQGANVKFTHCVAQTFHFWVTYFPYSAVTRFLLKDIVFLARELISGLLKINSKQPAFPTPLYPLLPTYKNNNRPAAFYPGHYNR